MAKGELGAALEGLAKAAAKSGRAARCLFRWMTFPLGSGECSDAFATDDGQFGILLEPVGEHGMFTFQLLVGGQVVGDAEPCFPASGLSQLSALSTLDDERLSNVREDPAGVLALLVTSEEWHDHAVFSGAESLDLWLTCAYLHHRSATILAQARRDWDDETLVGPIRVSVVPLEDYEAVLEAARAYFVEKDPRQRAT